MYTYILTMPRVFEGHVFMQLWSSNDVPYFRFQFLEHSTQPFVDRLRSLYGDTIGETKMFFYVPRPSAQCLDKITQYMEIMYNAEVVNASSNGSLVKLGKPCSCIQIISETFEAFLDEDTDMDSVDLADLMQDQVGATCVRLERRQWQGASKMCVGHDYAKVLEDFESGCAPANSIVTVQILNYEKDEDNNPTFPYVISLTTLAHILKHALQDGCDNGFLRTYMNESALQEALNLGVISTQPKNADLDLSLAHKDMICIDKNIRVADTSLTITMVDALSILRHELFSPIDFEKSLRELCVSISATSESIVQPYDPSEYVYVSVEGEWVSHDKSQQHRGSLGEYSQHRTSLDECFKIHHKVIPDKLFDNRIQTFMGGPPKINLFSPSSLSKRLNVSSDTVIAAISHKDKEEVVPPATMYPISVVRNRCDHVSTVWTSPPAIDCDLPLELEIVQTIECASSEEQANMHSLIMSSYESLRTSDHKRSILHMLASMLGEEVPQMHKENDKEVKADPVCSCSICSTHDKISEVSQHTLIEHFVCNSNIVKSCPTGAWCMASELIRSVELYIQKILQGVPNVPVTKMNKTAISQSLAEFVTKKRRVSGMTFSAHVPSGETVDAIATSTIDVLKARS